MKLYLLIIFFANLLIDILNIIFLPAGQIVWYMIILYTALCTIVCFLIDLVLAYAIRALPEKWFSPQKKCFKIFDWEKQFYESLGVKYFKDKIPEVGRDFRKNKISDPKNPEYLHRYMLECCYGEVIHLLNIPFGFLAMFALPLNYFLTISLPVALVNAVLSIMPIFVLRYNRKKIQKIFERLKSKTMKNFIK